MKNKTLTILFIICYIVFGWTIVIPLIATRIICDTFFKKRVTPTIKIIDENFYPGLIKEPVEFKSKRRKLRGGLFYYAQNSAYNGLVVVAHGIGCGMNNYLNIVNYFAKNGYKVFIYDMTGVCSSEGPGMIGLQQSAIDLKNAIDIAQSLDKTKGLKTYVVGHSLGGYASCAALKLINPKQVEAVACMAGFNDYWDVMEYQGIKRVGRMFSISKAYIDFYFGIRLGKISKLKAIDGINAFNKKVLLMHSKDDPTVPIRIGVISYLDECTNKNVKSVNFDNRGHTLYRPIESEKRIDESLVGVEELKDSGDNVFQYQTNKRYWRADIEDVFGVDDSILDIIKDFFEKQ